MQRLLSPDEFQYLRERGVSEQKISQLRKERRTIYRLYLRSLVQDFDGVHQALKLLLVSCHSDRPDLANVLIKLSMAAKNGAILAGEKEPWCGLRNGLLQG